MDEWQYEQAEARSQAERDAGISRARQTLSSGPKPVWCDGEAFCCECGDSLPPLRADNGWGRCVPCQSDYERFAARGPIC